MVQFYEAHRTFDSKVTNEALIHLEDCVFDSKIELIDRNYCVALSNILQAFRLHDTSKE